MVLKSSTKLYNEMIIQYYIAILFFLKISTTMQKGHNLDINRVFMAY